MAMAILITDRLIMDTHITMLFMIHFTIHIIMEVGAGV